MGSDNRCPTAGAPKVFFVLGAEPEAAAPNEQAAQTESKKPQAAKAEKASNKVDPLFQEVPSNGNPGTASSTKPEHVPDGDDEADVDMDLAGFAGASPSASSAAAKTTLPPSKNAGTAAVAAAPPPRSTSSTTTKAANGMALELASSTAATPSSSSTSKAGAGPSQPSAEIRRLKRVIAESATMQGRRPKQEDRHVKIPDLTKAAKALKMPIDHLDQPCSLLAVYDGHQGQLCAEFVAKSFHTRLLKKLSAEKSRSHWTDEKVCSTIRESCEELDQEFLAKFRTAPDGCTLVLAFITGSRLFTAWIGDSRALLCRESSQGDLVTVALTEDHRPSLKSEAVRIRKAGGQVVNFDGAYRVAHEGFDEKVREIRRAQAQGLGMIAKYPVALAVSRAMGDRHFKAVTGKALLVGTPSVRCIELNPSCRFVALMCDGVTDVMKNEEVIFELSFTREEDPLANARAVCGALVSEAYKRGSEDNLTVIFAPLEWETAAAASGTKRIEASSSTPSTATAPAAKRQKVEGAAKPEEKKEKKTAVAANLKELSSGAPLGPGRFLFRAQPFWQEVLPEQVTTRGLETRLGLGEDRRNFARVPGEPNSAASELSDNDERLLAAAQVVAEGREDEKEVAAALRRAASWGNPMKIRRMLASTFATVSSCCGALCEGAAQGAEPIVAELLRARADPSLPEPGGSKRTALHVACAKGQEKVGEMLILAGADMKAVDAQGRTPVELAREMEFGMMAKRLQALAGSS